jgi:superfamily II DNA or RNA helicase
MPVKFYPEKPLDNLEKLILKEDGTPLYGEIDIYRSIHRDLSISSDEWYVWHDLKLPHHSDYYNEFGKTSAQIDFVILCKYGILVIEVKGGAISVFENCFYYGKDLAEKLKQDPFRQSEGYKHTLRSKVLNNLNQPFICHAAAFPHVDYAFESKIFDDRLLWTKKNSSRFNNSIEVFIVSVFRYEREKHGKYGRTYKNLDSKEISLITKTLSPLIRDKNEFIFSNTLEWLQINNLEIIEGLYKNKRIMIEGPPGSGKTTIAKAYMDQQRGKRGIYICWNNFLKHYTERIVSERIGLENIEVTTLTQLVQKLNPKLPSNFFLSIDSDGYYLVVKSLLESLESKDLLPNYDFMIIDEAQDVFDKGIDLVLNKMSGYNKQGLINGTVLLLYDNDQSYIGSITDTIEIADLLSEYFAHFKLNEIKRSAQNPQIREISRIAFEAPTSLIEFYKTMKYTTITVKTFNNLESVKKFIVTNYLSQIRDKESSLLGSQCIILIESVLLADAYKSEPGLHYWLTIKDMEELTANNITDKRNKLRYTSILKYKGLEKENVFLIVSEPKESNKYEIYVGITRAINNLQILIVND